MPYELKKINLEQAITYITGLEASMPERQLLRLANLPEDTIPISHFTNNNIHSIFGLFDGNSNGTYRTEAMKVIRVIVQRWHNACSDNLV